MNQKHDKFKGVAVVIPNDGRRTSIEWSMALALLAYPVGMNHTFIVGHASKEMKDAAAHEGKASTRDKQREMIAEKVDQMGAEYMMCLDDDTIPPPSAITDLFYVMMQHPKAAIVGGIYCTKEQIPQPLVWKEIGGGPYWDWTVGDVFPCAGLGTGCMLIRMSVLKNIPKPWFLDTSDSDVSRVDDFNGVPIRVHGSSGTDDLWFCQKVLDAGYEIWAHGGIIPVHEDQDGNYYMLPKDSGPMARYYARLEEQKKITL